MRRAARVGGPFNPVSHESRGYVNGIAAGANVAGGSLGGNTAGAIVGALRLTPIPTINFLIIIALG